MIRKAGKLAPILVGILGCSVLRGHAPPTILVIDVENNVEYQEDISDPSKFRNEPEHHAFGIAEELLSSYDHRKRLVNRSC